MPEALICPNCDAPLRPRPGAAQVTCDYCHHVVRLTAAGPQAEAPAPRPAEPKPVEPKPVEPPRATPAPAPATSSRKPVVTLVVALVVLAAIGGGIALLVATREREPTYQERLLDPGRLSAESRQDRLLGLKLGAYVKVVNGHVERTHFTMRHYLTWAWSGLAVCSEDKVHSWGIHSINLGNGIWLRHAAAAREREPRIPALERGGELYIAGLRAFASLANQAKKYYTDKDWQDDGCARGKALHAKLFKAYGQFKQGEQQLRAALDKHYPQLHRRRLKLLEVEEPGALLTQALRLRLQARELLGLALAQATSSAPRADSLRARLASFEKLLGRLVRTADGLPEKVRNEARRQAGFDWTHRNDAEKFVTATKLFARELKARQTDTLLAGRAVTLTDKDWGDRQGSIGLVVETFNELNENGPGGGVIYIPRALTVQQVPRGR